MPLRIGIIGLPNVGKSTTFNALTQTQNAEVANYPFCTIEPNKAIVPVPDDRLSKLASLVNVDRAIPTTIEFMDIAGLVEGASKGEGLGNQFLGQIRNTDALLHIVRCFEDPNVVHVSGHIQPNVDIGVIQLELVLADLEQLERKVEKLERESKGDKKLLPQLEMARKMKTHLQDGSPLSTFPLQFDPVFQSLDKELRFLTSKPVIYIANVQEDDLKQDSPCVQAVKDTAQEQDAAVVKLCAVLEEEMIGLQPEEKEDFLTLMGIKESGLNRVIRTSYRVLDLISFFTFNKSETRAWTIKEGTTAVEAAGVIHSDFQKGFIKAEVIPFSVFEEYGSKSAAKNAGKVRIEGKEYIIQDGDIVYFRFNI